MHRRHLRRPSGSGWAQLYNELSADVPREWYPPLWKLLGSHAWHQLRTLRPDGMHVCETGLMDLLKRRHSLLNLQFCKIDLYRGSYKSVLSRIRSMLSL
jgi:hypothetical protein